ncbi:hypothetical protein JTM66_34430, partial [Pseudomonas aeruginosa]|nr:hypothetical protein [Pseudomonas aeruginosa]
MPWQVAQSAAAPGSTLPGIQRTDLPVDTAQTRMLRQVDTMMESLQEKTGSWLQGGMLCAAGRRGVGKCDGNIAAP